MPRYTIEFSDEVDSKLEYLQRKLDTASKAGVVRKALGLLDYIVREKGVGGKIYIESDQSGTRKEIVTL